jgi:aryl-alcohol dehydrogenase-like predicted oxidoreductase
MGLDQGVGVLAWSPLHYGLLSGKFRRDARPAETRLNQLEAPGTVDLERVFRIVDVLASIGQARGVSAAQVALNWVVSRPGVCSVILGARNDAQLRDNLAAVSWRLSADEIARLDAVSALPEPYPYWHQHKFGLERNPRVPPARVDGWRADVDASRAEAAAMQLGPTQS